MRTKLPLVALAVVTLLVGFAQPAAARRYQKLTPKLDRRAAMRVPLTSILNRSGPLSDDDRKKIDTVFKGYYFPTMTQYDDPKQLGELADLRGGFFTRYVNLAKSDEARTYLTTLAFKYMSSIAVRDYHPAVRYNAVLMLGSLDKEPVSGSGRNAKPPVPLSDSTKVLLVLLERDELSLGKEKKMVRIPASLKAGALVGLERQARFGLSSTYADKVTAAVTKVAKQKQAKPGIEQEVHDWMRLMAARVLMRQYAKQPNAEVLQTFTDIIADGDMRTEDRCMAAQLLQKLEPTANNGLDFSEITVALAGLAGDVMQTEVKLANEYKDELLGGSGRSRGFGGGGYGGGGYGGASRGKDEPRYEIRRMLARVASVLDGMLAVGNASPEAKEKLAPVYDPLSALAKEAGDKDAIEVSVAKSVDRIGRDVIAAAAELRPAPAIVEEPLIEEPLIEEPLVEEAAAAEEATEQPAATE